jgi:hypothetical protein
MSTALSYDELKQETIQELKKTRLEFWLPQKVIL